MHTLTGLTDLSATLGIQPGVFWVLFTLIAVWAIAIKGVALWNAARNHQRTWFIVLLILNSFGILELVYLIWFRKDKNEMQPTLFTSDASEDDSSSASA